MFWFTVVTALVAVYGAALSTFNYVAYRRSQPAPSGPDFQKLGSVPQAIATTIGSIILVIGWSVSYQQSIERDVLTKQREERVRALSRSLEDLGRISSTRSLDDENVVRLQNSLTIIQIYGNDKEAMLAMAAIREMGHTRGMSLDELLNAIRDDLRSELSLSRIKENFSWIDIRNPGPGETKAEPAPRLPHGP